jgi:8-oxo-dGTP diphosphatase
VTGEAPSKPWAARRTRTGAASGSSGPGCHRLPEDHFWIPDDGFPPRVGARVAAAMMDLLWRLAYRIGFRAARLWWRLRRPDHDGAVVAVWFGGRILAIRQSYRSNLFWPGGGIRRGEEPRDAARRELREELGLTVAPDDLVLAREMVVDWDFRRDRVRVFELRLDAEPALRVDNREVVAASFVDPRALLAEAVLPPFIRAYLGGWHPDRQRPPPPAGA